MIFLFHHKRYTVKLSFILYNRECLFYQNLLLQKAK
nr:MAG TPA: hypothetical protein [Caudoviricetes sp.]